LHDRRVGRPYEFDFVPAGARGFWEDHAPMEMISVRLAPSMLAETAQALELPGELAPKLGARDAFVEHIGRALDAELEAPAPAGRLYADSLAVALSTRLLQNFAPAAPGRQLLSKAQIRRFVEYVEEHLDSDLGLAELAAVIGLSVPHMTTLFRRTMGQTVHSYVMERRVCRARALLLGGRAAIAEVALEAGFAHQSHLARWMRRLLGVTPSELARLRS
jgi:AraC family transcriptional regulator